MEQKETLALDPSQTENALDYIMAKDVGDTLNKHYPGHLWAVYVKDSLIYVKNLMLSGKWGFIVKTADCFSATELNRRLVRAGGELLERYRQRRTGVDMDGIMGQPLDAAGNMTPEL